MDSEELRLITSYASLAPSVHNTQPWQFAVAGHTLEVRADVERQLSYLDASSRLLHLSCGAAIEFARLAVRVLGHACIVRLVPRADEPRLLATLTIGGPDQASPMERQLLEAALRRYTDRGPYDDKPVPSDVIDRMRGAAAEVGCWVRVLDRPSDRLQATILLQKAEEIEVGDPRYRQELGAWRRTGRSADGIPARALPVWPQNRVCDVALRDFDADDAPPAEKQWPEPPTVERDTLVLVGSEGDDRVSWLRSGRALAAVLLAATDAGVVAQPLGQVTDLPATRLQLQRGLGLLGYPQLLLRMGYGHGWPATGRRSVEETLSLGLNR
ncbi:MAG TPA: nitroreductase family protein [Mycobacteriales bacterium]|nr:nitroreductase family protein [Mycobacteriales bacterium]